MRRFLSAFLVAALISGAVYFQFQPSNKTIHHQSKHPPVASISEALGHF